MVFQQEETRKKTRQTQKNQEEALVFSDWSVPIDSRVSAARANL
jgi:hypothetical protein